MLQTPEENAKELQADFEDTRRDNTCDHCGEEFSILYKWGTLLLCAEDYLQTRIDAGDIFIFVTFDEYGKEML